MAEGLKLERLRSDLSESIRVVGAIEGADVEALMAVNSMLSEFFINIDGKTFAGSQRDINEINRLFAELERMAFSKTVGTEVIYLPHKLEFSTKSSGDEVVITVLEVEACMFRAASQK